MNKFWNTEMITAIIKLLLEFHICHHSSYDSGSYQQTQATAAEEKEDQPFCLWNKEDICLLFLFTWNLICPTLDRRVIVISRHEPSIVTRLVSCYIGWNNVDQFFPSLIRYGKSLCFFARTETKQKQGVYCTKMV